MIKECCSCEWRKELTDKYNRKYYICMDCDSPCFLEETGLCGDCTIDVEDEDE